MAVLVRSVTHQVPLLLRCALHPGTLDEDSAIELLTGPLGGSDALGLRRLRRSLQAAARAAGEDLPEQPLAAALRDPRELTLMEGPAADAAGRLARLLSIARESAREGTAHDVLWAVWDASGLAPAWQAASAAGGSRGAAADRDLDAVCALFDSAARFTARLPPGSPVLFLQSLTGQEIPGDTLAERAAPGHAVRILTAHRAKGLEWDLVVVAGVQEGVWPGLRMRSSLLGMDELVDAAAGAGAQGADATAAALASKLLNEERRLFYVAITRARRALVVTAAGGDDSEERPSRFLAELAGGEVGIEHVAAAGQRWLLEVAVGARSQDVVRHFGIIIHAAAVLAATGADEAHIGQRIDEIWHHLDFGSAWYSEKQREQAHRMVRKFLAWHQANGRELVAVEQALRARIGAVEITGRVDRLERDDAGRAVVVDLKTGSVPVPGADLERHAQLGVYQLAVLLGAFERFGLTEPGGAELVQVGKASLSARVRVQSQRPLPEDLEPGWARDLVETVAGGMAGPVFEARVNTGCRNCPVKSCCPVHTDGTQVTP